VALLNYEASSRVFPAGAQSAPYRTMGVSWIVPTLPFLEEGTVADAYDRRSMHSGDLGLHASNRRLVAGRMLAVLRCPSSPLPEMDAFSLQTSLAVVSYVGIAGATSHDGFDESRIARCCWPVADGEVGAGGLLSPGSVVAAREITDGASKTLLVAEQSNHAHTASGHLHRIDGGVYQGWIAGTSTPGVPPNYGASPWLASPAYNITTLRYPINTRDYNLPGVRDNRGPNNPLVSAHRGAVHAAFADGSIRAIDDAIAVTLLKSLATRDDGV
jgi:hypothetical protein